MKKLIDSEISKFLTSFNIPVVCIDFSKEISWDEYMEIYNVMKDCAENRKMILTIYTFSSDSDWSVEDINICLGIPDEVDTKIEEGDVFYNFSFIKNYLNVYHDGDEFVIRPSSDWACGWRPNDPSDIDHKGLGKIEEWL